MYQFNNYVIYVHEVYVIANGDDLMDCHINNVLCLAQK